MMEGISGLFAPLVTPFTDDGSTVSDVRLSRQIRFLLDRGISGFVTTSDTGEFLAMSFSERKSVLEITVRESKGAPVLAHISSMSTLASLDLAQHAGRHGARGAVVMPPYYGRYTDEEVAKFFETIATYGNISLIIVDPLGRLNSDLHSRISQIPMTVIAKPVPQPQEHPTYSDSFCLEGMVVTPAALFKQSGDISALDELFSEYGGKRICKAGFEIMDIDMGSPRAPAMAAPFEITVKLRDMVEVQEAP